MPPLVHIDTDTFSTSSGLGDSCEVCSEVSIEKYDDKITYRQNASLKFNLGEILNEETRLLEFSEDNDDLSGPIPRKFSRSKLVKNLVKKLHRSAVIRLLDKLEGSIFSTFLQGS